MKYATRSSKESDSNGDVTTIISLIFPIAYTSLMDRAFIDRRATESDHLKAKKIAQAVLDGRTTVLEAARELVSLAHTDAVAELEDRKFIIAVASETDDLPVGEVRKLWAPYALREKDLEIARAEELYRADFLETCQRIVKTESLSR
jgi:hypothetical protein